MQTEVKTTAPVTAPPVVTPKPMSPWGPARSPWAKTESPWASKESPWGPPKASPWGSGGGNQPPPRSPWASSGDAPDPWRNLFGGSPGTAKKRVSNRLIIIVPKMGPERRRTERRLMLPVSEMEFLTEMEYSEFGPGDVEDFDEMEEMQAQHDCGCMEWDPFQGRFVRDPDYDCSRSEQGGDHRLMGAWYEAHECPLVSTDLEQMNQFEIQWPVVCEVILESRAKVAANPRILFDNSLFDSSIAMSILSTAGFDLPEGFYGGQRIVDIVLANQDDPSVRAATLDVGATMVSHIAELARSVAFINEALEQDVDWRRPRGLQFMFFDPRDLGPEHAVADNEGVEALEGTFKCTDATYRSIFDDPALMEEYEWMSGWRELTMRRCDKDSHELVNP